MDHPRVKAVYLPCCTSVEMDDKGYEVGLDGVTRICEGAKPGEGAMVIWYQVFKGDKLFCEVNSVKVEQVVYFEE